jgi:hypothetical protein
MPMLVLLLMLAAQGALASSMQGLPVGDRACRTKHASVLHLRGGAGTGTTSRFYVHDGIATGSRRHMNTNLVESPEWKELREALRNHGEVSSSKPGTVEAAEKLISNHIRVMLDMTNPFARSQRHLGRLSINEQPMIDRALLEFARRLLVESADGTALARLQPQHEAEAKVWAQVLAFLDKRLQSTAEELPEREPDMSPSASEAFRAVLREMSSLEAVAGV